MNAPGDKSRIRIELFAGIKQIAGVDSIQIDVRAGASSSEILDTLTTAIPEAAGLIGCCRLAVDCQYVAPDQVVDLDADLAVIPPVSGG